MAMQLRISGTRETAGRKLDVPAEGEFTVGRKESCNISYASDSMISARHMKITRDEEGHFWLQASLPHSSVCSSDACSLPGCFLSQPPLHSHRLHRT